MHAQNQRFYQKFGIQLLITYIIGTKGCSDNHVLLEIKETNNGQHE